MFEALDDRRRQPGHRHSGFTLVELMVAVAILGVLAAIGIPAFETLILNSRQTTVANDLLISLQLARSEAAKRNVSTTMCPSENGTSCAGDVTKWTKGWIVFVESAGNEGTVDTDEPLLRYNKVESNNTIKTTGGNTRLTLRPFNQGAVGGTLVVCDKRGTSQARWVIVAPSGRARITTNSSEGSVTCS